jgi:hypothetical protein
MTMMEDEFVRKRHVSDKNPQARRSDSGKLQRYRDHRALIPKGFKRQFRLVDRKSTGKLCFTWRLPTGSKPSKENLRKYVSTTAPEKHHDIRDQGQYREFRSRGLRIRAELYTLYEKCRVA